MHVAAPGMPAAQVDLALRELDTRAAKRTLGISWRRHRSLAAAVRRFRNFTINTIPRTPLVATLIR